MKLLLALIFLTFSIPHLTYAQLQGKEKIDSLYRVYDSLPDSYERVMTSARLYYEEIYSDPKKGKMHAKNSISISNKIDYPSGVTVGLFHLGVYFDMVHETDSSKFYYSESLNNAQRNEDEVMITKNYSALAGVAQDQGDFKTALEYRDFANSEFKKRKDYLNYGIGIGNRAMIYTDMGDYKTAIQESLRALRVLDTIEREPYRKADLNSQIGDIEMQRDRFEQAIDYYEKALKVFVETNDNVYVSNTQIKLGNAFMKLHEYKQAKNYLKNGIEVARQYDIKDNLINGLSSLGSVLSDEGSYSDASKHLNESLRISSKDSLSVNHISTLNQLGGVLTAQGKYDQALNYINSALDKATQIGAKYQLKNVLKQRAITREANKSYQTAVADLNAFIKLSDSLENVDTTKQIEELKTIYETEKKEAEIALKEQEINSLNEKSRADNLQKGLYAGGMASALALFGLSVFGYRQRIKKNRIAREKQEEIYKKEIEHKQKELASQTLHLVQKNTFIQELKENLIHLKNSPEKFKAEFRRIVMLLKKENASDKDWDVFKTYFADVHNDFDQKLKTLYSDISEKEIRLAAFLRMNLTTKEIAATLNVLPDSILKSKYRLKKKLGLDKETDLGSFLNTL